jgi:hypothetical protein
MIGINRLIHNYLNNKKLARINLICPGLIKLAYSYSLGMVGLLFWTNNPGSSPNVVRMIQKETGKALYRNIPHLPLHKILKQMEATRTKLTGDNELGMLCRGEFSKFQALSRVAARVDCKLLLHMSLV